ncbi:hypothetical protein [methanotrophic endosymbiont of Bathymodiolus puteoserpentis (Logatchev)]|uniref:hypothetical protein n=1 Tax=methanotrophic endosymbiont of Bathymodiolus puteoserpentis (Logatchev) TaxID=343235 RepID=UPI00157AFFEC|nr:hypothetical protein [methanotrophic endosymbiont of Bathymodiolus puteoserpentis (Logatchev)]
MNKSILIPALISFLIASTNTMAAGGHGGHGSSVNKSGKSACKAIIINHVKPKHLEVVSPHAKFSFWVNGLKESEIKYVEVTAKKIPVPVSSEVRTGFILFKGELPTSLENTAARIQVSVNAKRCPVQKGWLLKIAD